MSDVDERLVHALCAAAATEPGAAEATVRAHVGRLAPLAGPVAAERLVRAAVARLDGLGSLDALLVDETSTRSSSTTAARSGSTGPGRPPAPARSPPATWPW